MSEARSPDESSFPSDDSYQPDGDWEARQAAYQERTYHELRRENPTDRFGWSLNRDGFISPGRWQGHEPPRRNWLVDETFPQSTVGLVSGDGAVGKSLLLLQLLCCAATSRPWLGLRAQPGRGIYMACEDDEDELWRRCANLSQTLDMELADIGENLELWPRVGQSNSLIEFERFTRKARPTETYEKLRRRAKSFGASYVVIDTATMTFSGNQNDEIQVTAYVTLLRRLAIEIQGAVILTKHPSLTGRALGTGESGNVAWNNAVRARLYLTEQKDGRKVLRTVKSNYGPAKREIPLKWHRGAFVLDEPEMRKPYAD